MEPEFLPDSFSVTEYPIGLFKQEFDPLLDNFYTTMDLGQSEIFLSAGPAYSGSLTLHVAQKLGMLEKLVLWDPTIGIRIGSLDSPFQNDIISTQYGLNEIQKHADFQLISLPRNRLIYARKKDILAQRLKQFLETNHNILTTAELQAINGNPSHEEQEDSHNNRLQLLKTNLLKVASTMILTDVFPNFSPDLPKILTQIGNIDRYFDFRGIAGFASARDESLKLRLNHPNSLMLLYIKLIGSLLNLNSRAFIFPFVHRSKVEKSKKASAQKTFVQRTLSSDRDFHLEIVLPNPDVESYSGLIITRTK